MKINKVLADSVTINTPTMSKYLKRNVCINNGFPKRHSRYKMRKWVKLSKARYHMKR